MAVVTKMVFTMHCCKRLCNKAWLGVILLLGMLALAPASADELPAPKPSLQLEQGDDAILLSTQFDLTLPAVVEEALNKGIPIYFSMSARLLRERWYWTNEVLSTTRRQIRLAYHPLTRRWRSSVVTDEQLGGSQGLSFEQSHDSLETAMSAIRRVSGWLVAEGVKLAIDQRHRVDFIFELDVERLPRPLQIGTLGQSDWKVSVQIVQPVAKSKTP